MNGSMRKSFFEPAKISSSRMVKGLSLWFNEMGLVVPLKEGGGGGMEDKIGK